MTTHRNRLGRVVRTIAALTLALGLSLAGFAAWTAADAQNTRRRSTQAPAREQPLAPPVIRTFESNETVQADISTRTIPVTSNFSGTEIVIFGAVDNSRQKSAESGLYDIVITVEGAPSAITSRRKVRFFGIWLNSEEVTFDDAPSFYAQVSTRPTDDFASNELQREYDLTAEDIQACLAFAAERERSMLVTVA